MQKLFPILTDLNTRYTDDGMASLIPDSFLGGSAPRLRRLILECIPFPGLPKLLLSATDLVHLELYETPDSGYIPADAMVTCLSTLTRLEFLMLCFESPRPLLEWERRRPSSSTRALLPSLVDFTFRGVGEYLELIVDRIDAPLLDRVKIESLHRPIFDTTQLAQFIGRLPKFKTCNEASICLSRDRHASVELYSLSKTTTNASLLLEDWLGQPGFQLSTLVQLCTSSVPQALIPSVERLIVVGMYFSRPLGQDGDSSLWRELLQPFTAVKDLYLSPEIAPHIALVLQGLVGESVMELLPVLQNIVLKDLQPSGLVPEGIEQFVAARQLASHPVSVSRWAGEY
jgi:hypothetical protein